MKGKLLQSLTWLAAREVLNADTIVVLPMGAAAKEHGPHLRLDNDLIIAEFMAKEILHRCDVVVAPTINYSYYPAFVEYPGSTSLSAQTACNMVVEICQSLARFGPARFYVANTGISTIKPLKAAAEILVKEGVLLTFTDLHRAFAACAEFSEQEGGSHADEIETSLMLAIAPDCVDPGKAARDFDAGAQGRLSPDPNTEFSYSPSGVWGDATLASVEKGRKIVEYLIKQLVDDIEDLRALDLPIS